MVYLCKCICLCVCTCVMYVSIIYRHQFACLMGVFVHFGCLCVWFSDWGSSISQRRQRAAGEGSCLSQRSPEHLLPFKSTSLTCVSMALHSTVNSINLLIGCGGATGRTTALLWWLSLSTYTLYIHNIYPAMHVQSCTETYVCVHGCQGLCLLESLIKVITEVCENPAPIHHYVDARLKSPTTCSWL